MSEDIVRKLKQRLSGAGCHDNANTEGQNSAEGDQAMPVIDPSQTGGDRAAEASKEGFTNQASDETKRVKAKKKQRRKPLPTLRIYCGTFVHSTKDDPLVILKKWMIGVDGGKIIFSDPVERYREVLIKYHVADLYKEITTSMEESSFMMPGFVDAHTSAVGLLAAGVQEKPPTVGHPNGLGDRRSHKLSYVHDDRIAKHLFNVVLYKAITHGTTCMAFNGSHVESATRLLADTLARGKQRSFVGMDVSFPENSPELHIFQTAKARDVIDYLKKKESDRVKGHVIISSPLPPWLQTTFADIHRNSQLPLKACVGQLPLSDLPPNAREWMVPHRSEIEYYKANGMLNPQSIFVHCRHCSNRDLKHLVDNGSTIVYCPSSDFRACSFTDLDRLVHTGISIGLGSDLPKGDSLSMLVVMRQALQAVRLHRRWAAQLPPPTEESVITDKQEGPLEGDCQEEEKEEVIEHYPWDEGEREEVTYQDLFRMATLGGATALGLMDTVGNFEIGKSFDAFLVDPQVPETAIFAVPRRDKIEDMVEKFIFMGDDRNITRVYISGERVK